MARRTTVSTDDVGAVVTEETPAEIQNNDVVQVEPEMNLEALVSSGAVINLKRMTPEQRGEITHAIFTGMQSAVAEKDMAWVKLGLFWAFVQKNKLYKYCGDHITNANDFLREADLGIKRRELQNYAALATIFGRILRQRNVNVPIRKLAMVHPMIVRGGDPEEWIDKAIALNTPALEDEIREARGLPARDVCAHPADMQEVWMRCGNCGKWIEKVNH